MNKHNKKLKIAIVSDAIYPYNIGGKEKRIYEISTRLAKKGHKVTIYCMKWWRSKGNTKKIYTSREQGDSRSSRQARTTKPFVTLHAISKLYPLYSGKRRSIKEAIMFSLACLKLIREDFDFIDADHMPHLVLFPLKIVSVIKRKKLYATWNEVWCREYWVKYMGIMGNIAYLIEWLSSRMPDEIIAVSKHTKEKLHKVLKVKRGISVIPNGIDLQAIRNVKASKEKSDVIFAGRLLEHKNVDILIKSISKLKKNYPNIKCVIVGKGPEEQTLKLLVNELRLNNNIIFYDFLEKHNELYSLMKSSKVFAMPSTREGFGLAALEANACGIPFVTSDNDNNATKDLVGEEQNGEIALPGVNNFTEKLKKLIKLSNKINKNKYEDYAQNYDWVKITNKIEEVYNL